MTPLLRFPPLRPALLSGFAALAFVVVPANPAPGAAEETPDVLVEAAPVVTVVPAAVGPASSAEPRLRLRAPRVLMLRPRMPGEARRPSLEVRVTARLEDLDTAENPEDYYCLEEVWDWDDDTESVYEPDCDPYEPGADIETYFFGSHRFSLPGTYRVWLRLQRSGETVIAGNVMVRIRN